MSEAIDDEDGAVSPARKLAMRQRVAVALMLLVPIVLITLKTLAPPSMAFLQNLSFADMPQQTVIGHVLFVPIAGLLVTFFRLTLGIRVFGPFRPILIAFSFELTGILPGLFFLLSTVIIVMAVRPAIKALRLPYFGRITMLLSVVAVLIAVAIFLAKSFHLHHWSGMAHFPIVVLCLISEAFAHSIKTEGLRCGLWRGSMTILVAILLTSLAKSEHVRHVLLNYPEIMIMQLALITIISRTCARRLLQGLNPPAKPSHRKSPGSGAVKKQVILQPSVTPPLISMVAGQESANASSDGCTTVRQAKRNNQS